jgi:hypothetical protein
MPIEALPVIKLLFDAIKLLDGKFTNTDKKDFRKLVRALTDFRLLTTPNEAEYAGAVIASAQKLRELLSTTAQALSEQSGLERGVLALGEIVRQFLTEVEHVEAEIRRQLDLIVANNEAGVQADESSSRLLAHWNRHGYPNFILRGNYNLNVMSIEWEGFRIQFLLALGTLRGQFGILLSSLCEVMHSELPEQLASLTPGLDALQQGAQSPNQAIERTADRCTLRL